MVVAALATGAAGALGVLWLRSGTYRRLEETSPVPGHLWVAVLAPVLGAAVAASLAGHPWPVLLPYLVLVPVGLTLAAVDADVHRLPNQLTLPLIPFVLLALAVASAATNDWTALGRAVLAGLVVGGAFITLTLLLGGHMVGLGDAKLVLSLAPCLGWLSWSHVLHGLAISFGISALVAFALLITGRASRDSHMAFGPYLVAGTLLAATLG